MTSGPYSIGSDHWPGLAKLAEEAGELIQVIGKIIAMGGTDVHWDGTTSLRARLMEEMGDVTAAVDFLVEQNAFRPMDLQARHDQKLSMYRQWQREHSA